VTDDEPEKTRRYPGDVVVADGDGAVVVDVAKYAHQELASDQASRRELYKQLRMELDDTVL
jgi:regulator of RNase E activity RraA